MSKRVTPQELREKFLVKAAPLMDQYINAALGIGELESNDQSCRVEVWDVLKKLLIASTDKLSLGKIEKVEDILRAVTEGKCTLEQGEQLMILYKKALGEDEGDGSGVTIVINKTEEIIDASGKPKVRIGPTG